MASLLDILNDLESVIGAPFSMRSNVDPGGRAYLRHLLPGASMVLIRPGRAKFTHSSQLKEAFSQILGTNAEGAVSANDRGDGASIYNNLSDYLNGSRPEQNAAAQLLNGDPDSNTGSTAALAIADVVNSNLRYFEFIPAVQEYLNLVSVMTSRVFARLGGGRLTASRDSQIEARTGGYFPFWAENSSSVSESTSSEYGESVLSQFMEKIAHISRQTQYVVGKFDGTSLSDAINSIFGTNQSSGLFEGIGAALHGRHALLPKAWQNSNFQRSYNLSFKFYSPYGDAASIYNYVLLPACMIFSLALPIMRSPSSYGEPLLFQIDAPGYFASDMACCTSLSWTKGGAENLWADNSLPRQIDITMQIDDLYPVLMASGNLASLRTNISLMTFLDNLSSIPIFRSGDGTSSLTEIRQAVLGAQRLVPNALAGGRADVESFFQEFPANLFR